MMQKLLSIYLFTFLSANIVCGQNTYSQIIYHEDEDEFQGGIFESGADILLVSSVRKYNQDEVVMRVRSVDKLSGDIRLLHETPLELNVNYSVRDDIVLRDKYYLTGSRRIGDDGTQSSNHLLASFDTDSILYTTHVGEDGIREDGRDIEVDINGHLISCGLIGKYPDSTANETFVVKSDTLGQVIWTKRIEAPYGELKAKGIASDEEGSIYIIADNHSLFPSRRQASLIKLNTDGDSLWTKSYPSLSNRSIAADILMNQNGNLIVSLEADFGGFPDKTISLMELDTSGQILWSKSYYEEIGYGANARKIIELRDGGYATVLWSGYPFLLIFDADGNVKVANRLEQFDGVEVHHITELSDGSLAMLGYGFFDYDSGENKATLVLIRTDSNGDLLSNIQEIGFNNLQVYPNPTDGVINIVDYEYKECMLFDNAGRLLSKFSKADTIDLSNFKSGQYELMLINGNETMTTIVIKQ